MHLFKIAPFNSDGKARPVRFIDAHKIREVEPLPDAHGATRCGVLMDYGTTSTPTHYTLHLAASDFVRAVESRTDDATEPPAPEKPKSSKSSKAAAAA